MAKWWKDFKAFALKGNVIDMAVGLAVGSAFTAIVNSLINDIFMPVLTLLSGSVDFTEFFLALDGKKYASLAVAQEAGAPILNYGNLLSKIFSFIVIALCLFILVSGIQKAMKLREKPVPVAPKPEPRLCPFCKQEIHKDATRCPHCTSLLE